MEAAFLGLGIMGSRMAAHLVRAEHRVTVHNRTRSKADDLLRAGAHWADTPALAARDAQVLFTMLPHPEAVQEAALGEGGFLAALPAGALWVDCSTVHPDFSRQMAERARSRGVRFLDAPVTGSRQPAEAAQLVFLVGGEVADVDAARPLLTLMGREVIHAGPTGAGSALKLVFNHLLGTAMAAFSEAVQLGMSLGLPQDLLLQSVLGSGVAAPFLSAKRGKLEARAFEPDFPLQWMRKDLHLVGVAAYGSGAVTPLAALTEALFQDAMNLGFGERDFSALFAARDHRTDA